MARRAVHTLCPSESEPVIDIGSTPVAASVKRWFLMARPNDFGWNEHVDRSRRGRNHRRPQWVWEVDAASHAQRSAIADGRPSLARSDSRDSRLSPTAGRPSTEPHHRRQHLVFSADCPFFTARTSATSARSAVSIRASRRRFSNRRAAIRWASAPCRTCLDLRKRVGCPSLG